MIRLELVNEKTFRTVLDMKLSEEQGRYVAPNVVSLAQAWLYYAEARPYAVMDDETVVGFIMLDWDEYERSVGIWRFMIAPEHQRKGYGRQAIMAVIELAKKDSEIDVLVLDYVPGNTVARELYASVGFKENGKVEDGEIIMTMPLTDRPKVGLLTADADDLSDLSEFLGGLSSVPTRFSEPEYLENAIEEGKVKRVTLYGETVGVFECGELLLASNAECHREEALKRVFAENECGAQTEIAIKSMTRELCRTYYKYFEYDPDVFQDMSAFKPFCYSEKWADAYFDRQHEKKRIMLAIYEGETVVGEVIIKDIEKGSCSFSIHLQNDTVKGRGIGTKAERLLLRYVFDELGMEKVRADTVLKNSRSRHVLEKVGFRYVCTDGIFMNYEINRAEYSATDYSAV